MDMGKDKTNAADAQTLTDYQRVTAALSFLDAHWQAHPSLHAIARHVGVSDAHFHRLFSRWTGTSPKRFMDALTHDQTRAWLLQGVSVLDATLAAGLSSPSRLHDLFIAHEALTPGQAKKRGAGLSFTWGVATTPFGLGVFLIAPRGLSALGFADPGEEITAFEDLRGRYPAAHYARDDTAAKALATQIFDDRKGVALALYGTQWQRQVWRALLSIPPGRSIQYGALARHLGKPGAARAVGTAVGRNPVSWLIPCHRVLGSDARLTGYHWGVNRKRSMLAYEAANL